MPGESVDGAMRVGFSHQNHMHNNIPIARRYRLWKPADRIFGGCISEMGHGRQDRVFGLSPMQDRHIRALLEKLARDMSADEACAADNKNAHGGLF